MKRSNLDRISVDGTYVCVCVCGALKYVFFNSFLNQNNNFIITIMKIIIAFVMPLK